MALFGRWPTREGKEVVPEKVAFAAIEYRGERFVSDDTSHVAAFDRFKAAYPDIELSNEEAETCVGWLTTKNRFLTRDQGMLLGIKNKQVDVANITSEKLYSADLKKEEE